MRKSRFDEQRIAFVLRQGKEGTEGRPVAGVCRKAGISEAFVLRPAREDRGLMPSE